MKPRIEKKLSKKLVAIAPSLFVGWWVDKEIERMRPCWGKNLTSKQKRKNREQCVSVNGIPSLGGELDYWGEATDCETVWTCWRGRYKWHGDFPCHEFDSELDTRGFKPTARNLLKLAARCEREAQAKKHKHNKGIK